MLNNLHKKKIFMDTQNAVFTCLFASSIHRCGRIFLLSKYECLKIANFHDCALFHRYDHEIYFSGTKKCEKKTSNFPLREIWRSKAETNKYYREDNLRRYDFYLKQTKYTSANCKEAYLRHQ